MVPEAFNSITPNWKNAIAHVRKIAGEYWNRGELIKWEVERMLTAVGVDSSDKCNKTIDKEGITTASDMDTGRACSDESTADTADKTSKCMMEGIVPL
jgi:hypothetical protein